MKTTASAAAIPAIARSPTPIRAPDARGPATSRTPGTTHRAHGRRLYLRGALPFYGPYGDIRDEEGCETQFRASSCSAASVLVAAPARSHRQARLLADPDESPRKKVIAAIPDGRGVHMIDGKMQDDATWKQCKVMVNLAEMLAKKDPELAEAYGLTPAR